jgi:hypothetical protein
MTQNDLDILEDYSKYPLTINLLQQVIDSKNGALVRVPNLFEIPWDDEFDVDDNFSEILAVFPYYCLIPSESFRDKIARSSFLNQFTKWIVPVWEIKNEVDIICRKYTYISNDVLLLISLGYIRWSIQSDLYKENDKSMADLSDISLIKRLKSLKRRLKESPSNAEKSEIFIQNLTGKSSKEILRELQSNRDTNILNGISSIKELDKVLIALMKEDDSNDFLNLSIKGQRQLFKFIPIDAFGIYSQREFFRDLYHLFKLITKDEELLSLKEYEEFNRAPYDDYNDYKYFKVKILLGQS